MKYQLMFPRMTKKLFDEKERMYQIAVICIRLDELQTKGAVLQKMGKPTKNGTKMTFAPVQSAGEYEAEMQRILEDGKKLGMKSGTHWQLTGDSRETMNRQRILFRVWRSVRRRSLQRFDMILSGEKKEEYRDIKPYYDTRLMDAFGMIWVGDELIRAPMPELQKNRVQLVAFRNGYGKDVPTIWTECSLSAGYGREEWGAEPGKKYYILTIENIGGMKL